MGVAPLASLAVGYTTKLLLSVVKEIPIWADSKENLDTKIEIFEKETRLLAKLKSRFLHPSRQFE